MASTYKGVIARHAAAPADVRKYFEHAPSLVKAFPPEITVSYMFAQVERAHRMTLYCGVVKQHRADASLARKAVDVHYLSRTDFRSLFQVVFGKAVPAAVYAKLEAAAKVRDRLLHGQTYTPAAMRQAVVDVIVYAEAFNDLVHGCAAFRPFGALRGFKGRAKPLDKSTTRWLLKGMGFSL